MAKARVTKETVFDLHVKLTERELLCLRAMMQNPIHGQNPDDEDNMEQGIRHAIFDATVLSKEHSG